MNKIDILRYAWQNYRSQFRNYSQTEMCKDFGLALGKDDTSIYVGKSAFSKFLHVDLKNPEKNRGIQNVIDPSKESDESKENIEKYLERFLREKNNKKIRELIADKIIDPSLFYCRTTIEIDQLFDQPSEDGPMTPLPRKDFHNLPFGQPPSGEWAMENEAKAATLLAKTLVQGAEGVIHWEVLPWSGGTFVACKLVQSDILAPFFNRMLIIRPTSRASPFESQLKMVAETLSIDVSTIDRANLPDKIAAEIIEQKILLVVADAIHIPRLGMDGGLINDFLEAVQRMHAIHSSDTRPTRVFLVGKNRNLDWIENKVSSSWISPSISSGPMAFTEFVKLWNLYRDTNKVAHYDHGGPRLKRAKELFDGYGTTNRSFSFSEVRLHAFFSSNPTNYAYADPTFGFARLAASPTNEIPLSLSLMYDDVIAYLRSIWPKKDDARKTGLRSLQYCSTTKHWLSQNALAELSQPLRTSNSQESMISELTESAFWEWVNTKQQPFSIRSIPSAVDERKTVQVFELPNLVKAVVQDQWRLHQPFDRAIAHWRVARYLYDKRNDKERLQEEFPYAPHWGRSRFFFLGECIRHLMRSCETQEIGKIKNRAPLDDFPAQPEPGSSGAAPETVLDYCYAYLFQQQLNGNAGFGTTGHMHTTSRVMSKRHGAGKYATELLQLMSDNGEIGVPHPALRREFHPSFIKECGYATLDLGELETADRCFSRLVETEWEPSVRIPAMLDKALVKSEMMELDTARELIKEAADLAKSEGRYTDQIQGRIRSRSAFLDFLDKNYDGALEKLNKLLSNDIEKADTEQLHLKIAALSTRKDRLQEPISLCFSALFRETSAGHHHEALGFRIALARILREQGNLMPAEHVLLSVQNDIYQFGCSERTYLSFLREAGRNLLDQGKSIRAYCAYLRPCLLRARDRKFGRFVATTASLVKETLEDIKAECSRQTEDEWNSCIDQCLMDEKKHQKNSRRIIQSIANLDPLFGYYSESIEYDIESFRKEGAINAEIETVNKLLNL